MLYLFHIVNNVRKNEKTRRKFKKTGKIRMTGRKERSWAESWESKQKYLEEWGAGKENRQREMRRRLKEVEAESPQLQGRWGEWGVSTFHPLELQSTKCCDSSLKCYLAA